MGKQRRLPHIAAERKEPPEVFIPRMIEETGSVEQAARQLGVAQNTIRHWLMTRGYEVETKQVAIVRKKETA